MATVKDILLGSLVFILNRQESVEDDELKTVDQSSKCNNCEVLMRMMMVMSPYQHLVELNNNCLSNYEAFKTTTTSICITTYYSNRL